MATVRKRTSSSGTTTYAVLFRHNSRQRSKTFVDPRSADDFVKAIDVLGVDGALARLTQATTDAVTLDQLAEEFFTYKESRVRSDRTVSDYRRDYRNWASEPLGERAADTVTEIDIQAWVDSMVESGELSNKSILDRHAILYGIYSWASAPGRRKVSHNPCIGTDLPSRTKTPPKGLRPAEWQALYPALRKIDDDGADLALFMLASGWRVSEAAAVDAYDCVELPTGLVMVNMTRVLRRNAAGQHVLVEDGKSAAAMRVLTLDLDASAMVKRRLEAINYQGLVFTTKKGAQWHSSNFNNRIWKPAVRAAKLDRKPTPHWLRHTSVGWLIQTGKVSLPEIQRRIGHEHISTTVDVYGRMVQDVNVDALSAFAAMRQLEG